MLYNIIGADGLAAPANKDWIYLICLTLTCHAILPKKQLTGAGRLAALTKKDWICLFNRLTGGGLATLAKKLYKIR